MRSSTPESRRVPRRRLRWPFWLVIAAAIVASIGTPLLGLQVFSAADMLQLHPPWRAAAPHGFVAENAQVSDTVNGVMPMRAEFFRRLQDGDFALWTDEPGGGATLGAVPDGSYLSPLALPFALLPTWYAPAVVKALEMLAAAAFTALFLRRLGAGPMAAAVAGLVYMNSGFQVAWTNWPQTLVGAFVPGLFWAVERAVQERRAAALVPVALTTTGLLLGGFPAVAGFALLAAGGYALVRVLCAPDGWGGRAATLLRLGAGVALGIALAAIQLLPFAARLSFLGLDYRQAISGQHLSLKSLVTAVVPWAYGEYTDGVYFGERNIVEVLSFVGAAAVLLMLVAAVWGHRLGLPRGVGPVLWTMLGIGVLLAYVGGPLLAVFDQLLPVLFGSNFVGRMRAVLCFFAAVLAGLGVEVVARSPRKFGRADLVRAAAAGAIVLALAWAIGPTVLRDAQAADQLRYLARHSVLPLIAFVVAAGVAVVAWRWGRGRTLLLAALPIIVVVEALAVVIPFWPRIPRSEFYPVTPVHAYLGDHQGEERVFLQGRTLEPGATLFYGIRSVATHQFFAPTWKEALRRVDSNAFVRQTFPMFVRDPGEGAQVATSPLLDRLSARYYVADPLIPVIGAAAGLGEPSRSVALPAGEPIEVAAPAGELRALRLWLASRYGERTRAELRATVLSPAGAELAKGTLRADDRRVRLGVLDIALPQIDAPAGSVVRLELDAPGGEIRVGADRRGVILSPVRAADDGLRTVFTDGAVVYERQRALPRFRWATHTRVVADPTARLDALAAGVPADTVVLSAPGQKVDGRPATVGVREGDGDEFRIDVRAEGAGYLVVADALQDGWTASVDGHEQPLVAADHAVAAVHVPAGDHSVVLRYEPRGWRAGRAVSIVAALVLVGLAGWRPVLSRLSRPRPVDVDEAPAEPAISAKSSRT